MALSGVDPGRPESLDFAAILHFCLTWPRLLELT